MKAAIYARYSSDKQSPASIDDQVRNCRAAAERYDWAEYKVFADEAMSGTLKDRPAYQRMLTDAKNKEFDVLIIDDLSRLSRDDVELAQTLKRLKFWEIRLIGVSDAFDTDSGNNKIVANIRGMMNSMFLDDLTEKTHRGLMGKALNGQNTGGRAYGYEHIPIEHPTEQDDFGRQKIVGVTREVDPEQAETVRWIFQWFVEGRGYREIAGKLNEKGISSLRGGKWGASSIRPMLKNETYVGRVVWNKYKWVRDPDTGKRVKRKRPQSEWVIKELPQLRIIKDGLWRAVQARRDKLLSVHKERQKANGPNTRPGKPPTYLLSGIVTCGVCGGAYIKANRTHYRCSNYINRGKSTCTNWISVRKDVMEERLLHAIKMELFDDDSFEMFKTEARRILNRRIKDRTKNASQISRQLAKVERDIANMISFVKAGTATPTLSDELRKAEAEKERLKAELADDLPTIDNVDQIFETVLDSYAPMASYLEGHAARDVTKARNIIKALVGGQITLHPTEQGGLYAEIQGDYGGLIELVAECAGNKADASKLRMVAGARYQL